MKKIYRKMMVLMNRKQKLKMVQILFMMVIGAILETVSIGLVVPAIQMIMDPSCVEGDSALAQIYRWTGFQKPGYFTTLILVLIILGFVLKNVFLYFQNVVQLRFVYTNQFETSQRMMINFMKRPYEYYLNADTSVIQRMITSDVNNMYGLILALLQLMSEVIIFVLLAVTLTAMAPQMILTVAALLIVTLLVIKQFLKPTCVRRASRIRIITAVCTNGLKNPLWASRKSKLPIKKIISSGNTVNAVTAM